MIKIVGINPYSFTDNLGHTITGFNIFCLNSEPESKFFVGEEAFKFSLSPDKFDILSGGLQPSDLIGSIIDVRYNKFGKVSTAILISQ